MAKKRKPATKKRAAAKNAKTSDALSDQLRQIIAESGLSRYAICKAAKIDPSQLHRFVNDRPGGRLTTDSLDRIGKALGLRLVQDSE